MPLDDIISETTDVDGIRAQQQQERLQQEMASPHQRPPATSLEHVIQLEKTDIQLWVDVATLGVLILILMRL